MRIIFFILIPGMASSSWGAATREKPFVNSLGMKFVPVQIHGGPTDGRCSNLFLVDYYTNPGGKSVIEYDGGIRWGWTVE